MTWTMAVSRHDLTNAQLLDTPTPQPQRGQAVLRVDRVGLTANNVTYAVLGDAFRYWEFFPAPDPTTQGLVPLWGFAEVEASTVPGVEIGQRLYGYLPPASHLLVQPHRVDERGFRDASPHRASLPSPYNTYALTAADSAYDIEKEDLQVLFRPLFFTSFMLADHLIDNALFGAGALLLSSASSKTAYGAAACLKDAGAFLVGLTSPGNLAFTERLGCYDVVATYDEVHRLPRNIPTAYLDVAGSGELLGALRNHLGASLVREISIGITQQQPAMIGSLEGPRPHVFFAPDQMRKRAAEWGRARLDGAFGKAWAEFVPMAERNVTVVVSDGPQALRSVWLDVLAGTSPPEVGNIITFGGLSGV